jgi:hypothetical protein
LLPRLLQVSHQLRNLLWILVVFPHDVGFDLFVCLLEVVGRNL